MRQKFLTLLTIFSIPLLQGCSSPDVLMLSEKINNVESVSVNVDSDWKEEGEYNSGKLYSNEECFLAVYGDKIINELNSKLNDESLTNQIINPDENGLIIINDIEFALEQKRGFPHYSLIKTEHESWHIVRVFNDGEKVKLIKLEMICELNRSQNLNNLIKLVS